VTAPFDTLALAKALELTPLGKDGAEAMARAMAEIAMQDVATKSDIERAVHTLTVRGFGALVALGGILLAAFSLFP